MAKLVEVAKVIVFDNDSNLLILQRSTYEAYPHLSHTPDLPGGLVEKNESVNTAAVRELCEETGIELDETDLKCFYAGTSYFEDIDESVTRNLYFVRLAEQPKVTLSYEHESYAWIGIDEVRNLLAQKPFYRTALDYALEHKIF